MIALDRDVVARIRSEARVSRESDVVRASNRYLRDVGEVDEHDHSKLVDAAWRLLGLEVT